MTTIEQKLQVLQDSFRTHLPQKYSEISQAWNNLLTQWNEADRTTLTLLCHGLAGSGATFGFDNISEFGRKLEYALNDLEQIIPTLQQQQTLEQLYTALSEELATPKSSTQSTVKQIERPPTTDPERNNKLIYIVDDDEILAKSFAVQLNHFGYNTKTFKKLNDLPAALEENMPNAIIMDINFPNSRMNGIDFIKMLNHEIKEMPPVFFFSSNDNLQNRLQGVRAGSYGFFAKPVEIGAFIDALDKAILPVETTPYRVLIVEDTPTLAQYYALTLEQHGMETAVVNDPMQTLEATINFNPEVILIDLYMPGCSGMEIAKVLRQQETYTSIPIIYLSAETSIDKQLHAMSLGGDDFLIKPITPEHLIFAVSNRTERHRNLCNLMIKDSLTGLYNHSKTKELLDIEVLRYKRHACNFCFAMIDLDNFKFVNDNYGHLVGDHVLKCLARLLMQRFRRTDIIGRYGGEEFAIILTDTNLQQARELLDRARREFNDLTLTANDVDFNVSFSCGIADFANHPSAKNINEAADKALYIAKNQGKNQIQIANNEEPS